MASEHNFMLQPDILYLILLELHQRELLLAQRVCKLWQATIQKSSALQRALFFEPDHSETPDGIVKVNELLVDHFLGFFLVQSADDNILGPFRRTRWSAEASKSQPNAKILQAYARREASWRRMLISRPVTTQLQVFTDVSGMLGTFGERKIILFGNFDRGPSDTVFPQLTFGLIYDLAQAYVFPSSSTQEKATSMVVIGVRNDAYQYHEPKSIVHQQKINLWIDEQKQLYKTVFPHFADSGCVLLHFAKTIGCCVEKGSPPVHSADHLRSEGCDLELINNIRWEERKEYRV